MKYNATYTYMFSNSAKTREIKKRRYPLVEEFEINGTAPGHLWNSMH